MQRTFRFLFAGCATLSAAFVVDAGAQSAATPIVSGSGTNAAQTPAIIQEIQPTESGSISWRARAPSAGSGANWVCVDSQGQVSVPSVEPTVVEVAPGNAPTVWRRTRLGSQAEGPGLAGSTPIIVELEASHARAPRANEVRRRVNYATMDENAIAEDGDADVRPGSATEERRMLVERRAASRAHLNQLQAEELDAHESVLMAQQAQEAARDAQKRSIELRERVNVISRAGRERELAERRVVESQSLLERARSDAAAAARSSMDADDAQLEARIRALEEIAAGRSQGKYGTLSRSSLEERVAELEHSIASGSNVLTPRSESSTFAPAGTSAGGSNIVMRHRRNAGTLDAAPVPPVAPPAPGGAFAPIPPSDPDGLAAPAIPSASAAAPGDAERRDLERALESLRAEADQLRAEMAKLRAEIDQLPRRER